MASSQKEQDSSSESVRNVGVANKIAALNVRDEELGGARMAEPSAGEEADKEDASDDELVSFRTFQPRIISY